MTPTQRTLERLRSDGYLAEVVERWIPAASGGFRKDMFGIIDVIAIKGNHTIGVQCFGHTWAEHVRKLTIDQAIQTMAWLGEAYANRRLELWSWVKRVRDGREVTLLRRGVVDVQDGEIKIAEIGAA